MLKTRRDDKVWLVSQPDHAEVSGYLAAHWGNEEFTRPGYYAASNDPEQLRAETVLAIAQHDNGWWEWEAAPELSEIDGLPLGLSELLRKQKEGMERWRCGIPRFSNKRPYVGLLISYHAYWLYYRGIDAESDPAFTHQLFSRGTAAQLMGTQRADTLSFIKEIEELQKQFTSRLLDNPDWVSWLEPDLIKPHIRLLQILDGLSLSLCSALICPPKGLTKGFGDDDFDMADVPRRSWEDRVTIGLRPVGGRRIACKPYPFDIDPLPVHVPVRILDWTPGRKTDFQVLCHSVEKQLIRYEYCSV